MKQKLWYKAKKIKSKGGNEFDTFSSWRKVLGNRRGKRKAAKRKYNRRFRRLVKESLKKQISP